MKHLSLSFLPSLGLAATVVLVPVQAAETLAPAADRLADPVIQADLKGYARMQDRIKALNDVGRPIRDYHLSKAQCWLDVSFHEYSRNDRSAFPQEALDEAGKLIAAMEQQRAEMLGFETRLVNDATRLRPDLWARSEALRQGPGGDCASAKLACAEVELVHAGNEFRQQQWRHARPYIQIAEDLIAEASQAAERCPKPQPVVAAEAAQQLNCPPPPPAPVLPAPVRTSFKIGARIHYPTDMHRERDILSPGRPELDAMVAKLKAPGVQFTAIHLVGRADLRAPAEYNRKLSAKRVATVRNYLIAKGIPAAKISEEALGADEPVATCDRKQQPEKLYDACLQSNRRVDVYVNGFQSPSIAVP
jgi:OmpA-OmpF porin, OOP family